MKWNFTFFAAILLLPHHSIAITAHRCDKSKPSAMASFDDKSRHFHPITVWYRCLLVLLSNIPVELLAPFGQRLGDLWTGYETFSIGREMLKPLASRD